MHINRRNGIVCVCVRERANKNAYACNKLINKMGQSQIVLWFVYVFVCIYIYTYLCGLFSFFFLYEQKKKRT